MVPSFDWLSILMLIGSSHSLVLSIIMFSLRREKRTANRIFGTILLIFALSIFWEALWQTGHIANFPHLAQFLAPLMFLFAPLFYLYVRAFTESSFTIPRRFLLHLIPSLLCAIYFAPVYFMSAADKLAYVQNQRVGQCSMCEFVLWMTVLQILPYLVVTARILHRHGKSLNQSIHSIEHRGCIWLRNIFFTVSAIWLATCILHLVKPGIAAEKIIWLLISLDIFVIGYMALLFPEVFAGPTSGVDSANGSPARKYKRSSLTPELAQTYLTRLQTVMLDEKPYLESDINMQQLAARLAMSSHHLSQIINEKLGLNFFEFINDHRIAEAKRRIADPANHNLNLAEIGLEVGFNSISSFNAAFKKHAGMTPSNYRHHATVATSAP